MPAKEEIADQYIRFALNNGLNDRLSPTSGNHTKGLDKLEQVDYCSLAKLFGITKDQCHEHGTGQALHGCPSEDLNLHIGNFK